MKKYFTPLFLTLALISCSSQSHDTVKSKDACILLNRADAEAALGDKVKDSSAKNFGGEEGVALVSNCLYATVNTDSYKTISILIRAGAPSELAEGRIQKHSAELKKQFGADYELEPVARIGDGAIWDPKLLQLTFFKGRDMVILSKHPGTKDELIPIAAKILAKL